MMATHGRHSLYNDRSSHHATLRGRKGTYIRKCGKLRYRNRLDALCALGSASRNRYLDSITVGTTDRREQRAYRCPRCAGFHLTSKDKLERPAPAPAATAPSPVAMRIEPDPRVRYLPETRPPAWLLSSIHRAAIAG